MVHTVNTGIKTEDIMRTLTRLATTTSLWVEREVFEENQPGESPNTKLGRDLRSDDMAKRALQMLGAVGSLASYWEAIA